METNTEHHHSKVNIIKAIIVVILFSMSLFLLWRQRLNSPVIDQVKNGEESALVVKTINESTEFTDIDVQIPQFTNASKAFNKKIEDHVRERVAEHKTETAENWQKV